MVVGLFKEKLKGWRFFQRKFVYLWPRNTKDRPYKRETRMSRKAWNQDTNNRSALHCCWLVEPSICFSAHRHCWCSTLPTTWGSHRPSTLLAHWPTIATHPTCWQIVFLADYGRLLTCCSSIACWSGKPLNRKSLPPASSLSWARLQRCFNFGAFCPAHSIHSTCCAICSQSLST